MAAAQALTVRRIAAAKAARALAGLAELDPRGLIAEADLPGMCERGHCFEVGGELSAVYVLAVGNGTAWVQAARGTGPGDLSAVLDDAITGQAAGAGLQRVAFQTARPGLVRKLQRRGYRVAGWIMRKDIEQ